MALTAADLGVLDRAIATGVLVVRAADGSAVTYRSMEDLLRARALIAAAAAGPTADPTTRPGGVSYAEWARD
jgi:hypothetical protein